MTDPWAVLGLGAGSSLEEARASRRRLAKQLHPDGQPDRTPEELTELGHRMAQVNRALAELEAAAQRSDLVPASAPAPVDDSETAAQTSGGGRPGAAAAPDRDSFTVDALPVDAFEALFVVGYGLGETLADEEPYSLQLYLDQPPCFCLLSLAPEAGGTVVTVDLLAAEDAELPPVVTVRDLLVDELNRLAGPVAS